MRIKIKTRPDVLINYWDNPKDKIINNNCGLYVYSFKGAPIYIGVSKYLSSRSLSLKNKKRNGSKFFNIVMEFIGTENIDIELYYYPENILREVEIHYIKRMKPITQMLRWHNPYSGYKKS